MKLKSIDACLTERWHLHHGKKGDASTWKRTPYRCNAWRCPRCAKKRSQLDFKRLREALESKPLEHLVVAVLTIPRSECEAQSVEEVYRSLNGRWRRLYWDLRKRVIGRFEFYWSAEAHADGRPHLNVIIHSGKLATMLRERPPSEMDVRAGRGPHWWRDIVANSSETHQRWGHQTSLIQFETKEGVASYVTKLDKGAYEAMAGELLKLSQLPVLAPMKWRRMGASKGFLQPRKKPDPQNTGVLVRSSLPVVADPDTGEITSEGTDAAEILREERAQARRDDEDGAALEQRRLAAHAEKKTALRAFLKEMDRWPELRRPKARAEAVRWLLTGPRELPGPISEAPSTEPPCPE